jgi:hypothetical protein
MKTSLRPQQQESFRACTSHLRVLVEEEEGIGHIVVAQVDDTAANPAANR